MVHQETKPKYDESDNNDVITLFRDKELTTRRGKKKKQGVGGNDAFISLSVLFDFYFCQMNCTWLKVIL